MKLLLASMLLAVLPLGSISADERFACNMNALTKSERGRHQKLSRALLEAVQEQKELKDGYGFRLPGEMMVTAAQWAALEGRCCPFFTFELVLSRDGGPLWLRITGAEGIKTFLRAELGLD